MLKAFTRVEATEKVPYDITAFDAWSTVEGKFFIVCWDKCHTGIYKLKPEDARVQSSEAVELVRSMKNTTPKPITQVAVLADYDVFLGLSDGEVYLVSLTNGQILDKLMKNTKALSFAIEYVKYRAKTDSVVRLCVATKKKLCFFKYSNKKGVPRFVPTQVSHDPTRYYSHAIYSVYYSHAIYSVYYSHAIYSVYYSHAIYSVYPLFLCACNVISFAVHFFSCKTDIRSLLAN
jgi:hypothetical protein